MQEPSGRREFKFHFSDYVIDPKAFKLISSDLESRDSGNFAVSDIYSSNTINKDFMKYLQPIFFPRFSSNWTYQCNLCTMTFLNVETWQTHIFFAHNVLQSSIVKSSCAICSLDFQDDYQFASHNAFYHNIISVSSLALPPSAASSSSISSFNCSICNVILMSIDALVSHVENSHNIHLFPCLLC